MVLHNDTEGIDLDGWCLAINRIRPSLEDLHQAIRRRDLRKISLLCVYSSVNVDSSLRSVTALSLAVQQGDAEMVAILLDHGASPNKLSGDTQGRLEPPLLACCRQANYETARMLLDNGADVNATDFNMRTPLWIATRERSQQVTNLLIKYGANLNAGDKRNPCPLYLATKYLGRAEIAKSLIRHGCKLDTKDVEGRGAIYWSLANNLADVTKLLIQTGARITEKDRNYMTNNRSMPATLRQNGELHDWIRYELSNSPSLMRLATNALRRHLADTNAGRSIWPRIEKLPIPKHIQHKLIMANIP